jgi:hypothetical protein
MKFPHDWGMLAAPLAILLLGWSVSSANAQQLEVGRLTKASTSDDQTASFTFNAEAAGILTVVARTTGESDIVLVVTDRDGQPLPNGRSDQDIGGNTGAEQFAVTIPRAGAYMVRVEPYGGSASFQIGASWLSFPDLEVPPDPDGSPSSAKALRVGQEAMSDGLDGSQGDYWDWFVFTASRAGTLTVTTRAEEGDLVLEAFSAGEYSEAIERSDQDLQGVSGNEALTLIVEEGQKFFFKVAAFSEGASIPYRIQVGFMPE